MFTEVAITIGSVIVLISSFLQLLSAVGIIRFPDFYVRLHAATVSAIGGSLLAIALGSPLVILGSSGLTQESLINVARCLLTALILFVAASTGSHVLARASYLSEKVAPQKLVVDELKERLEER